VNQTSRDAVRKVNIVGRQVNVTVPAGGSRLMLFDREKGEVIADSQKLQGEFRPLAGTESLK